MFKRVLIVNNFKKICLRVTFLVFLSIFSSIAVSAPLCSSIAIISDSTFKYLGNFRLNKIPIDVDSKNVDPELELAFQELTLLNHSERAVLLKDLQVSDGDHFGLFTAADFLMLSLYHKPSWFKLFQSEVRDDRHFFTSSVWWSRGFIFARMPLELLMQIQDTLVKIMNLYSNTPIAKKANRILTMIRIYLELPEIDLHKKIENKEPLDPILTQFFKNEANEPSHYGGGRSITAKEFGVLTYQLNELLKSQPFQGMHSLLYWFGSIPNGRGHEKSDFDFAGENKFTQEQVLNLQSYLKSKQNFVSISDDQEFTVHELKHSISSLLFLSPISIAFNNGRIFLTIRELLEPEVHFHTYNSQVSILEFPKVRLWHYPVQVTADGFWSLDHSVPVWIED